MTAAGDLITQLVASSPDLAGQVHRLLAPVVQARDELRARLIDDGQIVAFDTITAEDPAYPDTLCAVDGGCVREHLYAADMLIAAATTADGLRSTGRDLPTMEWAAFVAHESENDALLSAVMGSLEVRTLAAATHDLRILDGSYITPLLSILMGLHAHSATVRDTVADLLDDGLADALMRVATEPGIIALPKSDSAHIYTDRYASTYGLSIAGGDRFVATQILRPGELLYPIPARHLTRTPRSAHHSASPQVERAVDVMNEVIGRVSASAAAGATLVTYMKPTTTDTVLKVEYRTATPLGQTVDPTQGAVTDGVRLASVLSAETPGPHLQEPYAQHAVDRAAKNVSVAAQAVRAAVLGALPPEADAYKSLLIRGYRT